MDPHFVQDALKEESDLEDMEFTYHSQRLAKKIKMDSLDPCIGLGFLIQNGTDLTEFEEAISVGPL